MEWQNKICTGQNLFVFLQSNMKTPIVTLTTDWGHQGFFAGMVKGALYSTVEGIQVVDITHHVDPYSVMSATFVVKHACPGFPVGTVHIVDVATQPPLLVVKAYGQFFLCCDNGVPASAFGDEIEDAAVIPVSEGMSLGFAAHTYFVPVAQRLLAGAALSDIGPRPESLMRRNMVGWMPSGDEYHIYIHYIDDYGNAYLGMTYHEFEELRRGRRFEMTVREQRISEMMDSYYQQPASADPRRKLRLTVSATGLLELALKESSFVQLIGLRTNDAVILKFKD